MGAESEALARSAECLNCRTRRANATRGLCQQCYRDPEVLARFPRRVNYTVRQGLCAAGESRDRRPPREPTSAQPGSREKVAVLAERLASGRGLWHPDDETVLPEAGEGTSEGRVHRLADGICEPSRRHSWLLF